MAQTLNDIKNLAAAYHSRPQSEIKRDAMIDEWKNIPSYAWNAASNLPSNLWQTATEFPSTVADLFVHPIKSAQDFAGGVARNAQNTATALGEAGQWIGDRAVGNLMKDFGMTPREAPKVNIREEMGLGENRPFDLGKMIESDNPNPLLSALGQYAGIGSFGSKLPNIIGASALTSAMNANPEDRTRAAIEGAVNMGIPGSVSKLGIVGGKAAMPYGKAGWDYLNPGKDSERFRSQFGEGTSKENIAKIGEQVQSSYQEQLKKALEPKEKLFEIHKDTKIVPKQTENHYWQDSDASKYYNKGSTLLELHKSYIKNPTLENYDKLQSSLKKEQRRLESNPHLATDEKLNQIKLNIKNLDKDVSNWSEKLPENERDLEQSWRTQYKENVVPYFDTETPIALRNLAEGKWDQVTPAQIGAIFTRMTPNTKKIFADLPPNISKNIIYNAIQKVSPGDAGEMANTIIDMKRTKGYDQFIDDKMISWAEKMQKQVKRSELIVNALKAAGGAVGGSFVGGTQGALSGAILPFALEGAHKLVKKIKK